MEIPKIAHEAHSAFMNSPFIIGFGGAIAGVLSAGKMSIAKRISFTIIGGICAGYLSPWLQYMLGIENQSASNALAFIVGMLGMSLTGGVMKIGDNIKKHPEKYFKFFTGWKKH